MSNEKIFCGLCKVEVENWKDHENSEEHQNRIRNLGGINSIVKRKVAIDQLRFKNPELADTADRLFDTTNKKIENIMTGKKGYNIYESDNFEKPDGFIDKDGKWYSCDPIYHSAFANDYIKMVKENLGKLDKNLLKEFNEKTKEFTTHKDILIHNNWISVTVGLTDTYVQPGEIISYKQKKTLKKWFKKYKKSFRVNGQVITDEFHDFFQEVR